VPHLTHRKTLSIFIHLITLTALLLLLAAFEDVIPFDVLHAPLSDFRSKIFFTDGIGDIFFFVF